MTTDGAIKKTREVIRLRHLSHATEENSFPAHARAMVTDLLESVKAGFVSDPTRNFRRCDGCGERHHPDDLHTVDTDLYGEHATLEICDRCKGEPDAPGANS